MFVGTTVRSPRESIEVAVLVDGQLQPLYRRPSDCDCKVTKFYVASELGKAYALQVRNLLSGRIEVITTVDGRHTLKDEPGDLNENRGLVFSAHQRGDFSGWQLDRQEARRFVFGQPERSIGAQATGQTSNIGVMGFGVYTELSQHPLYEGYGTARGLSDDTLGGLESLGEPLGGTATRDGAPAAYGAPAPVQGGSVGTGMGERIQNRLGSTNFSRSHMEPDILVIGYDTAEVLTRQGIIGPAAANPFPGIPTGYDKYRTIVGH